MSEYKTNQFTKWPIIIICAILLILSFGLIYFFYFVPTQLGSSVNQNFQAFKFAYDKMRPLINELDSEFNSINILNVSSDTYAKRKDEVAKISKDIGESKNRLRSGLDNDTRSFYDLTKGGIEKYESITQKYISQINYYQCLLNIQSETNNNWSQVASQALQINQDTITNESTQKAALDSAELVLKNAELVVKYKECFSGDYKSYKTGEVETAIDQTSQFFKTFGEGYKSYFQGKLAKPENADQVKKGIETLNQVKLENIPTFEKKFSTAVFDKPGQDFGRKEVEVSAKFKEVVDRKNALYDIYRFNET